jgi:hypothetical protein
VAHGTVAVQAARLLGRRSGEAAVRETPIWQTAFSELLRESELSAIHSLGSALFSFSGSTDCSVFFFASLSQIFRAPLKTNDDGILGKGADDAVPILFCSLLSWQKHHLVHGYLCHGFCVLVCLVGMFARELSGQKRVYY